jgi:hypothetical protein
MSAGERLDKIMDSKIIFSAAEHTERPIVFPRVGSPSGPKTQARSAV